MFGLSIISATRLHGYTATRAQAHVFVRDLDPGILVISDSQTLLLSCFVVRTCTVSL